MLFRPTTFPNNKGLKERKPAAFMAVSSRSNLALLLVWNKSASGSTLTNLTRSLR
jgi:hypothetical protein